MTHLDSQIALVTGATGGIGRAIAWALAPLGARLCLLARDRAALDALAADLPNPGKHAVYPCDLADDAQLADLAPALLQRTAGRLDLLIHCAAAYAQSPFESAPIADLDLQYRLNLRAPYILTKMFLPQLRAARGQIVFLNSTTGIYPRPHVTQYAATKHALRGFADTLRQELAADGLRIISVYPGKVATPMQQRRHQIENKPYHPQSLIQPQDVAAAIINALILPRTAEVSDLVLRPGLSA